jgi:hypothetical protein
MSSSSEPSRPRRVPLWSRLLGRPTGAEVAGALPPAPPDWAAPPGFDWRWYLRAYTDLAPAGVTDEASAIRHWREHGCREGRRFAPRRPNSFDWLSYVDRFEEVRDPLPVADGPPRLVCPSIDSIFLRAWGDLVCWDDAGSERLLQAWDPAVDYAEVFLNGPYERIRRDLDQALMPWPEECQRCVVLRTRPVDGGAAWDRTYVRMLRVEPSYHCTLDCPGCVPLAARRLHSRAFQLDPEILDRILADLVARGLDVDALDFQGHGEPLLNPLLWEMVRRSRARLPAAWISMTTNAHGRFSPEMAASGLDEIICSIDGVDPETYLPYRVHGHFDLAWRFLTDFSRAGAPNGRRVRVVWKYVVFSHNSAPETLLRAQRMALEAGVTELVFVLTRNGPASGHVASPADIPRLEPGPPISFRFHQPSIADLEARYAESLRLESEGRLEEATVMATGVLRNLERFFAASGERPPRQSRLLEALERDG